MRILLINYEYPPLGGGGGIAHQDVAEALAARHDVHVLTTHYAGLPRFERRRGVSITRVPVWGRESLPIATIRSMVTFAPAAFRAARALVRKWRPDIVNAFFAVPSGLPAVLLGRLTGIPVVLTLVGADIFDPNPTAGIATHRHLLLRAVVRQIIRGADARVAISHDTRRRALKYHHAPPDIEVIPLGLVSPFLAERGTPRVSREQSLPPGKERIVRLVTIGRLIPRKGYDDLLAAIAMTGRSDLRLDLVGDGPLAPALRALATRLGIAERVCFRGTVGESEKWRLLSSADCFVSASLYEGFGIVFLEAMSAGLPIIATDDGGQTDFLITGENALLVPPGQPRQLASAIALLFLEDGLRLRMRDANLRKAADYRIERTAARYEELFARVLAQRSKQAVRAKIPAERA